MDTPPKSIDERASFVKRLGWRLTLCPGIYWMSGVADYCCVQFLPQDVDLVVQVDEEDVGLTTRTP